MIGLKLANIYNSDKYHIEFLDMIATEIPNELLDLYNKVLKLSLEAPFVEELNEDYQLAVELLCKALGYKFDINGNIQSKEEK